MQAFERTVKEARFGMVMVDAPNVSTDDLKGYWSIGQVHCMSVLLACCLTLAVTLCLISEFAEHKGRARGQSTSFMSVGAAL